MIYLNPRGGLCNRIRVIGSAIKLAKIYNDSITIFWRKASECGCLFEELFEDIIYDSIEGEVMINNVTYPEEELITKFGERNYTDTIADVKRFQEEYISKKGIGEFYLSTCYSFYDFHQEYDWLLPRKEIRNKVENIVKSFGKHCVGIHIRRTDHQISKKFSPDWLFLETMDNEIKINNAMFYLATDDVEVKDFFSNKYTGRITTNGYENIARQNREGMEAAVIDLYVLSNTEKIYGSFWSSFSMTAAAIGNIELKYLCIGMPEKLINKKIVIYGAGQIGRVLYGLYHESCEIVGWVDKNYLKISNMISEKILSPCLIKELDFDYIIIASENWNVKMEIKEILLDMGVDINKIIEDV